MRNAVRYTLKIPTNICTEKLFSLNVNIVYTFSGGNRGGGVPSSKLTLDYNYKIDCSTDELNKNK